MIAGRAFLYYRVNQAHQAAAMNAFSAGLMKNNIWATVSPNWGDIGPSDFIVIWGDNVPLELSNRPRVCLEAGYINGTDSNYITSRLRFISVGWRGLHGHSDPLPNDAPADRWAALGLQLAPWRDNPQAGRILLMEQHPGDATAPPLAEWQAIKNTLSGYDQLVTTRPHPAVCSSRPLADDLSDSAAAVTWASTAAVESVIAGVPTVVFSKGSIAWPVTSHSLTAPLYCGNRDQWAYNLAYRQWTHAELASGQAWWHIRHGLGARQ